MRINSIRNHNRILFVSQTLVLMVLMLFLYTFLHEAGHAILGMLFGQRVLEFDAAFWNFYPHVSMAGEISVPQQALRSLAGTILPLLIWVVFINLVPRRANFSLTVLKIFTSMAVINTLLTWIILPVMVLFGNTFQDDVINFLNTSGLHPLQLSGIALILYGACWYLFIHRMDGVREQYQLFKHNDKFFLITGGRRTFSWLTAILLPMLLFTLTSPNFLPGKYANPMVPPPGYQQIVSINLEDQTINNAPVFKFTILNPDLVGIYVQVNQINTPYFDLKLSGPVGFEKGLLHGEGYAANKDTTLFEETLPAGEYSIVLTSQQSPGKLTVYFHTP